MPEKPYDVYAVHLPRRSATLQPTGGPFPLCSGILCKVAFVCDESGARCLVVPKGMVPIVPIIAGGPLSSRASMR